MSSTIEFLGVSDAIGQTGSHLAAADYMFQCEGKIVKVRVTEAARLTLNLKQEVASPREFAENFLRDRIDQRGFFAAETITLNAKTMEHLVSSLKPKANS